MKQNKNSNISDYPTLKNFVAVSFTKNADLDKYKYSGYGIRFNRHGFFSYSRVELVEIQ